MRSKRHTQPEKRNMRKSLMNFHRHLMQILLLFLLLSSTSSTISSSKPPSEKPRSESTNRKRFVLVHGACHGAWSWYKVSTLLKSSGHTVSALDMAASGIDTRQAESVSSVSDYFEPLTEFMAALPLEEKVVLVGHSLGGLGVAMAMENFPEKISVAVFVTAAMPGPNLNLSTIRIEDGKQRGPPLDTRFINEDGQDKPPTALIYGPLKLASHLYPLSPPEDLTLANVLVRPLPLSIGKDPKKEFILTKEKYGSVKRAFIVSEKDLISKKKFQLWMIENNPPDIHVEIKGSDHMVMVSKPVELAHQLQLIAHQFSHLLVIS